MSGWKVSASTSGILIIVENKRTRNRKQPFFRNSSETVVNRTTFQQTEIGDKNSYPQLNRIGNELTVRPVTEERKTVSLL